MKKLLIWTVFIFWIGLAIAGQDSRQRSAIDLGAQTAQKLGKALKSNLMRTMKNDGLLAAATFCSDEAMIVTASVNDTLPPGVSVSRVSAKNRNPENAPTDFEQEILNYFEAALKSDEDFQGYYFHEFTTDSTGTIYHYFKPAFVAGPCLKCHGPQDSLDPEVLAIFQKNYPEDKALDYTKGELRGMAHVTMTEEAFGE